MSFVPSQYLVRLQELKLWQGNYDNLLQKQKDKNQSVVQEDLSDLDGLDGVTPLRESKSSPSAEVRISSEPIDWDKQTILPTKPFNQLLEEKLADSLAEYKPSEVSVKVKKPFLKKGAGLARYRLNSSRAPRNKNTFKEHRKVPRSDEKQRENVQRELNKEEDFITPLKAPDFSIKCKAAWSKVDNENEIPQHPIEQFHPNPYVIGKINELALSLHSPQKWTEMNQDLQTYPNPDYYRKEKCFENSFISTSENELLIFETLEEKIDHSSFLSTNSSITKLLASTRNDNRTCPNNKPDNEDLNVCQELRSSDILTKILNNLKLITLDNTNGYCIDQSRKSTPDTSFSEDKVLSNNGSFCQTPSSYTEFENTLGGIERINTGVNTSFSYIADDGCSNCKEFRQKLEKLSQEIFYNTAERAKLYDYGKELERKCDRLNNEIGRLKENSAKDVEDLRDELEEERKKFAREKALLDMYIKDVRPKKKECIEMENIKKELIDLKELLKLKEAKNGTTQARLRNQIKQLEKDKTELKSSVENLQKENAKLNATQKVHRNAEARMLQEISRNLNKLTEEKKGETNNTDVPNNTLKERPTSHKKIKRRSMGELKEKIEKELLLQESQTKYGHVPLAENRGMASLAVEVIYNNELMDNTLENQYESSLGLVNGELPRNESLNHLRKVPVLTEREFSDGSREIKFANGTSKTISPDGKLIYIQYANGDIRETNLTKMTHKYFFVKKNIWLTKCEDGTEIIEFPNGQKEERSPDGKVLVTAIDGTTLTTFPEGTQEINYPDGSKMVKDREEKIIYLPNGQKETHTPDYKKREYPDGTVKIIYPDGTQESRYANGRVRVKDETGALIMDSYVTEMQS